MQFKSPTSIRTIQLRSSQRTWKPMNILICTPFFPHGAHFGVPWLSRLIFGSWMNDVPGSFFFCCPYRSISAQVFWSLATASLNQDRAVWKACWKCRCYLDHAGSTCHYLPLPLPHSYEYYKFTIIHLCILFHSSLILCEGWYFEHFSQASWTGWEF